MINVKPLKTKNMDKVKFVFGILVMLFICNVTCMQAQDEIALTVSADGVNKEEAIKSALRSAIEQAYGAFVSSNTSILNDELIKDEIVTISTGNIKDYKEISSYVSSSGNSFVTLQVTVCPSKLISYAQSKGAEVEFAGATFAMNLKMKELNKRNEEIAIKNMLHEMDKLYSEGLDYTGEPKADGKLKATIEVIPNEYGVKAWELFYSTLNQLTLTADEQKEYEKADIPMYVLECYDSGSIVTETDIIKEIVEQSKERALAMGKKWNNKEANKIEKYARKHLGIADLVESRNKALNSLVKLKRNFVFRSFETLKNINSYLTYYYIKRIFGFTIKAGNKISTIDLISSLASYDKRYARSMEENYICYEEKSSKVQGKAIYTYDMVSDARYLNNSSFKGHTSVGFQRKYIADKELLGYIVYINDVKNFSSFFFDEGRGQGCGVMVSYPPPILGNAIYTIYLNMQIPMEDLMKIAKIEIQPRR